jgi:hypothetical protein
MHSTIRAIGVLRSAELAVDQAGYEPAWIGFAWSRQPESSHVLAWQYRVADALIHLAAS